MLSIVQRARAVLSVSPLRNRQRQPDLDWWLLTACLCLLGIGLVMNASASTSVALANHGDIYYYFKRHLVFVLLALGVAFFVLWVPMSQWYRYSWQLLVLGWFLLVLVFIPGIGHEVNGSKRWLKVGGFTLQSSEFAKLFMVVFMAGYLVRHRADLQHKMLTFIKPLGVLSVFLSLLFFEPDFGASVVMFGSVALMIFLAGLSLKVTVPLLVALIPVIIIAVRQEEYRMARLLSFMDPWKDQYGTGYQLSQSLIAFGRGEWLGLGLGNSIQKQFYLPEAHTDFVFAVLAEEFGMLGSLLTLAILVFVCIRALQIGIWAEKAKLLFFAYLAYGIGIVWIGQVFINIGANVGFMPTKGLTLPFISYGGSSLLVCCIGMAILLRIEWELRQHLLLKQSASLMSAQELSVLARGRQS